VIKPEEYKKMIELNRRHLVNFLQELLDGKLKPKKAPDDACSSNESMSSFSGSVCAGKFPINER
jgi:hypothetical protein